VQKNCNESSRGISVPKGIKRHEFDGAPSRAAWSYIPIGQHLSGEARAMGEVSKDRELMAVDREALSWVGLLVSGDATVADIEALSAWRTRDPSHEKAFQDARKLWNQLQVAGDNVLQRQTAPLFESAMVRRPLGRRAFLTGSMATACLAAGGYFALDPPLGLWPSVSELTADYRTQIGGQRQINMEGVSAALNTRTSINVRSDNGIERIELVSGEASFVIARAAQNIVITAGDGKLLAGDGALNVRADEGRSACVTCIRGELQVERNGVASVLSSGQQLIFAGPGLGTRQPADIAVVTAWQNGELIFRSTPFAEVIDEVNRYRPGRIVLLNPSARTRKVNSKFRLNEIDGVITMAQQIFNLRVTSLPGGLLLLT
jgi:transmembrane sensor